MIKCKDCKHYEMVHGKYGACNNKQSPLFCVAGFEFFNFGCIHAERADGLTECCATCKHLLDKREKRLCAKNIFRMRYDIAPLMEGNNYIDLNKMLCPEWAPREEKR